LVHLFVFLFFVSLICATQIFLMHMLHEATNTDYINYNMELHSYQQVGVSSVGGMLDCLK